MGAAEDMSVVHRAPSDHMSKDLVIGESIALVVIDLQKSVSSDPDLGPYPAKDVIENSARLIEAFRESDMPFSWSA